jgi:hypothetical protein
MGWNEELLQNAVNTCTNLSGEIYDCPLFTIQDDSVSSACQFPIPADLESENAESPGTTLPGNVHIQSGPAYATYGSGGGSRAGATSAAVPTLPYSAGVSTDIAGGIFAEATSSYSASPVTTTPSPSPTAAPTINPLLPGESIVSTMYTTLGNEVMEIVMVEQEITVYVSTTATAMTTVTEMRRRKHRRHGHAHVHDHY